MKLQIRRLTETARALREQTSTYFSITRLTSLKSLCKEPAIANQFVCHLAECVLAKTQIAPCPKYCRRADWEHYRALIAEAVPLMRNYRQKPTEKNLATLRKMRLKVESVQNYTGKEIWGHPIRAIHSKDVLVIEDALQCMSSPETASYWAYQAARDYAECYNPLYGSGLIPESAPMLEDILRFWSSRS